jgi:hypothetical protein
MKSSVALRGAAIIALLAGFAAIGGCGKKQNPVVTAGQFPESNQAAGWTTTGETRIFAAADLWQYIDGDAEKYMKAGVQSTSTADYKFHDKIEAVVDIHTMSNADGPKAIFDSEPAMDAATPQVGEAARLFKQSLLFRKGRYLVRIVTYQDSPDLGQALVDLGLAIERRLPN